MSELRSSTADHDAEESSAESARVALLARLEQLGRNPVRPAQSLQPTPEAAKSKIRRLRLKRRILIQRSKSAGL
jgi:hypothetical protein